MSGHGGGGHEAAPAHHGHEGVSEVSLDGTKVLEALLPATAPVGAYVAAKAFEATFALSATTLFWLGGIGLALYLLYRLYKILSSSGSGSSHH